MPIVKQCAHCGNNFEVPRRNPRQRFCSPACGYASRRRPLTCPHPGEPHQAHGMCSPCYARELYKTNLAVRARAAERSRTRMKNPAKWARVNGRQRARYAEDPAYRERKNAWLHRDVRSGWSPAQVKTALIAQDYRCAVCGERRKLSRDHCHDTGRPRALLCQWCNTREGFLRNLLRGVPTNLALWRYALACEAFAARPDIPLAEHRAAYGEAPPPKRSRPRRIPG